MSSLGGHSNWLSGGAPNKITKTRSKGVVKPIMKKLQSHSEKNSLDLDRGWEEQTVEKFDVDTIQEKSTTWSSYNYHGQHARSARDVSFAYPSTGLGGGVGTAGMDGSNNAGASGGVGSVSSNSIRAKFQHGRSASQASTGSGSRGAFVHPFQQTPRTATPPLSLSYANSLASFDNGTGCDRERERNYSPTITENEDDEDYMTVNSNSHHYNPPGHSHQHPPYPPPAPPVGSQSNLRRPSLASQRTGSYSDVNAPTAPPPPPPLRINTGRTTPIGGASSRGAHGGSILTTSRSDLHLDNLLGNSTGGGSLDSPTGSIGGTPIVSPSSGANAMSPLRTSLDMAGFPRLRSRSEVDTAARAENIRNARRKFEAKERIKEEKYDREMIKKREKKDNKEASRIEKESAAARKSGSFTRGGTESLRIRPSASRKTTPTTLSTVSASAPARTSIGGVTGPTPTPGLRKAVSADVRSDFAAVTSFWESGAGAARNSISLTRPSAKKKNSYKTAASLFDGSTGAAGGAGAGVADNEKHMGFASRDYESAPVQTPPAFIPGGASAVDDVRFDQARPRRSSGAKRKTQGYWQGFILWLRTKLLRLSGH